MRRGRLLSTLAAALAAALILTACGGATAGMPAAQAPMAAATAAPAAEAPAGGAAFDGDEALEERGNYQNTGTAADPQAQQPAGQRLVIKNASISLEVESVAAAEAQIRARAEQLGGYVVSVQTRGSDEYMSSVVTFRVPAQRFEDALSGVEGLARKVLGRTVGGEDVTEEFVDLESRLRNLEATRDRLLDLLDQAVRVEDALQVNQALTEVQGEIEHIQGRMKFLTQSAAFSTITADLQPVPPPPTIYTEDAWQPLRVAQEALAGLVEFGQGLASLAIVLVVWSPVWVPLLLLARWVARRLDAVRGPRVPPAPPAGPIPPQA
ncbi:MAG TPA: DUF4349 domain-containing protein [Chloroflexaceae bacterium]|nr:DUF4349 domain-containing protein [Chloroflexaceae bacterium]